MGWNLGYWKVGALAPWFLTASAMASSLPYSDTARKSPLAERNGLQTEWAAHLVSDPRGSGLRESREIDRGQHNWNPRAGIHVRYPDTSEDASSGDASTASGGGGNAGPSSEDGPYSGAPSWLTNYGGQEGGSGEYWQGGWASSAEGGSPLAAFGSNGALIKDEPANFDPIDPTPEPGTAVFLLAGVFAVALFVPRFQIRRL